MRILIITDSLDTGGAETHVLTLAQALFEMGHHVAAVSGGGRNAKKLTELGIRHYTLPIASHLPKTAAKNVIAILKIAKAERVQILHAHSRTAALLGSIASSVSKLPLVVTAHAKFSMSGLRKRLSFWGRQTIAVSEDIKEHICASCGIYPDNVSVIENGIDTRIFSLQKRKPASGIKITFISRMDGDCSRAAYELCRIAPSLHKLFPSLSITLVGGGDELLRVRQAAKKASAICDMRIDAIGAAEDTASILRDTDIFVGVSRAALEAMACGVPTILFGNEGYFGIIDESNFFLAQSDNFCARGRVFLQINELFNDICTLCNMNYSERSKLGDALSKNVLLYHSAYEMARKTVKVYKEAAAYTRKSTPDILLCGYYGYKNTGDDALLFGAIKRANEEYTPAIIGRRAVIAALTANGRADEQCFGIRCVRRNSPIAALREIKRAKLFVFGGGTLLQDRTSKRSLLFYLFLLRYAQRHGVRCELWANGLGISRLSLLRPTCSRALSGCYHLGVRDPRSAYAALSLSRGACVSAALEEDLALSTEKSSPLRTDLLLAGYLKNPEKPFVFVALNGSSLPRSSARLNSSTELAEISDTLARLESQGFQPMFAAMNAKEDAALASFLAARFDTAPVLSLTPRDLRAIISRASLVLSSRFHALLFAKAEHVKFKILGDDPKLFTVL